MTRGRVRVFTRVGSYCRLQLGKWAAGVRLSASTRHFFTRSMPRFPRRVVPYFVPKFCEILKLFWLFFSQTEDLTKSMADVSAVMEWVDFYETWKHRADRQHVFVHWLISVTVCKLQTTLLLLHNHTDYLPGRRLSECWGTRLGYPVYEHSAEMVV